MIKLLALADVLIVSLFAIKFNSLPVQIPLLYSNPWGEAQIVDVWYIILIPVIMNLIYFANSYLVKRLFSHKHIFESLFWYSNLIFIIGFTGVFFKIIFLVT
ncbi:hypothetical protein COV58_00770 [Candidatus Roizmanbacteria bacterium CG11_big_fil_rev_8_21_14_0_20_36_8]|uniref:DUF5658 domain-containing protein n=2 Tax=Candidatus Roizmaniibacteriota TaxID=1752723 RepID=A0A2M6IV32_9BACT|nr:MAG: hypothetical protein COV58_00770 [Candidatus Roizmanbacteria bacterium CG11_big_fil_rev_8_21_14_0_20_36_8]PIZ64900.1 MAG: hypothetical protein COY14_03670 [Candidatus Roizmanbacteria bacterium CG_4_10_14_0_2_um_filter_36_9]